MSIKAMTWVFDYSPYTLGVRLVHLAIADVVNDDYDNRVFLGDSMIAAKARVSRGTVVRAKAQMIAEGYLEAIDPRTGPGKFAEYRFLTPGNVREIATRSEENVRDLRQERARSTKSDLLLTKENSSASSDPLLGFDHFWTAYPMRGGRRVGRRLCQKRWRTLSLEDRRAAYRGACNYAKECGAFAKDPDRWLRDRMWEDWQGDADAPATVTTQEAPFDPDRFNPVWDA